MKKEEALKKLADLENETAKLRKIIESPEELVEVVSTIEEVYKRLNRRMLILSDFNFLPEHKRVKALNTQYLRDIEELFNEGWIANWKNSNEYKHFPYFEYKSSGGLVFIYSDLLSSSFYGDVCYFKSEKISTYIGKTFIHIYEKLI